MQAVAVVGAGQRGVGDTRRLQHALLHVVFVACIARTGANGDHALGPAVSNVGVELKVRAAHLRWRARRVMQDAAPQVAVEHFFAGLQR